MKLMAGKSSFSLWLGISLVLLISGSLGLAQEKTDEALKKMYAPILGEYEFDLTDLGEDTQMLLVLVADGDLWIDSGDGDPAAMKPIEGAMFEFTAEASDGQAFEIRFVKDDKDQFSICQINIVSVGLEIKGTKIK